MAVGQHWHKALPALTLLAFVTLTIGTGTIAAELEPAAGTDPAASGNFLYMLWTPIYNGPQVSLPEGREVAFTRYNVRLVYTGVMKNGWAAYRAKDADRAQTFLKQIKAAKSCTIGEPCKEAFKNKKLNEWVKSSISAVIPGKQFYDPWPSTKPQPPKPSPQPSTISASFKCHNDIYRNTQMCLSRELLDLMPWGPMAPECAVVSWSPTTSTTAPATCSVEKQYIDVPPRLCFKWNTFQLTEQVPTVTVQYLVTDAEGVTRSADITMTFAQAVDGKRGCERLP